MSEIIKIKPIFTDETNEIALCPTCSDIIKIGTAVCENCDTVIDWEE